MPRLVGFRRRLCEWLDPRRELRVRPLPAWVRVEGKVWSEKELIDVVRRRIIEDTRRGNTPQGCPRCVGTSEDPDGGLCHKCWFGLPDDGEKV